MRSLRLRVLLDWIEVRTLVRLANGLCRSGREGSIGEDYRSSCVSSNEPFLSVLVIYRQVSQVIRSLPYHFVNEYRYLS